MCHFVLLRVDWGGIWWAMGRRGTAEAPGDLWSAVGADEEAWGVAEGRGGGTGGVMGVDGATHGTGGLFGAKGGGGGLQGGFQGRLRRRLVGARVQ